MMATSETDITKVLQETRLWPQILLENYLFVALGHRECSLTTIPAEYPDAIRIAESIDQMCVEEYRELATVTDPKRKVKLIGEFKKSIRRAFQVNIQKSTAYAAHLEWSKVFGLSQYEMEVRPSVRELFMFKDKAVRKRLKRLHMKREQYRNESLRHSDETTSRSRTIYPEEFRPDYVRELSKLLGYPSCCTDAYISGRTPDALIAEEGRQPDC